MSDLDGNNNKNTPTCPFNLFLTIFYLTTWLNLLCMQNNHRFWLSHWPLLWLYTRENMLSKFTLMFYLYARTAKVLSFWIRFRTILTSWGWKSWRGKVCPGIRIDPEKTGCTKSPPVSSDFERHREKTGGTSHIDAHKRNTGWYQEGKCPQRAELRKIIKGCKRGFWIYVWKRKFTKGLGKLVKLNSVVNT